MKPQIDTDKHSKGVLLRGIPSIEEILQFDKTAALLAACPRSLVVQSVRSVLDKLRQSIKALRCSRTERPASSQGIGTLDREEIAGFRMPDTEGIFSLVEKEVRQRTMPLFRRSINATGIVLHTGLGRAVLPASAVDALKHHISGYSRLAVDLKTGLRKDRDKIIEGLICEMTGAQAATVVNNNAAATILILNTLAKGKEVVCSRGQMVEIGGSFRIPDIMETSGARLKSIGTTNRTHLKDYQKAINANTGALLKVHASNFRIVGFTSEVDIKELAVLGHKHKLPVIDDIGSGALIDLSSFGLTGEPLVSESIKAGADVICFSSDKLMGGPQAGIIIGKKKYIEVIRKNPLYRAFRAGKLTLVALEETLKLFRDKDTVMQANPTLRMLTTDRKTLGQRAEAFKNRLADAVVIDDYSQAGSGSLAGYNIPTKAVAIKPKGISAQRLSDQLRQREIPILARLKDNRVLFDMRTILDGEDTEIINALKEIIR
ncbi:MAG: L-seryl-tRNA(Sec) selenium transferase [Planctomycetes bacterium]|nr:L-seryl-tRNA(Sec) selenium transferase [Planctomycetota bacterium]